jgi:hypothetical protein
VLRDALSKGAGVSAEDDAMSQRKDPTQASRDRLDRSFAAFAVAAIVFAPYVTVRMPYRTALVVQATLIMLLTASLLAVAATRKGWFAGIRSAPRWVLIGVLAYSGAALLGAFVALLRGNDPRLLAGQLLSMGLLPAAVIAGLTLGRSPWWRGYLSGIVVSVGLASCVHVGYWILRGAGDPAYARLFFANKVSAVSAALIAVNVALALLLWNRRSVRWAGLAAIAAMLLLILGSGIRSLWLVTGPSLVVVVATSRRLRTLASLRNLRRLGVVAALLAGALAAYALVLPHPTDQIQDLLTRLKKEALAALTRFPSEPGRNRHRGFMADESIAYRVYETKALATVFVRATPTVKLFGRGLGFTFTSKDVGLDEQDNPAPLHPTNYIHNFYLFLLIKLGFLGGAAGLVSLTLFTAWTVRAARAVLRQPQRTFLIAASAVWIAGLVWNLSSPEFLDFRMAPLWGLLLAACVNAERRDS